MSAALPSPGDLQGAGVLATTDAVASVTDLLGMPGSGAPERVLRARIMRGFDLDVLPGRGFDVGDVSFRGIPISWSSPVRDARALAAPSGTQWLSRFVGGLVTTCGLGNFGPATATEGLHGDIDHLPARDVSWEVTVDPTHAAIELWGTVESVRLFGDSFRLERSITSSLGADDVAELRIVDVITNIGLTPAGVHTLYHLNFGAPLVAPGTLVRTGAERWIRREEPSAPFDPDVLPQVTDSLEESVFEYGGFKPDASGKASAHVINEAIGLAATVSWSIATLPRLYQWVLPTRGRWALGIEPANAPLFGPDRSGPHLGAPVLAPGASVRQGVSIRVTDRYGAGSAIPEG